MLLHSHEEDFSWLGPGRWLPTFGRGRLCAGGYHLGLKTEGEKLIGAAVESTEAAKASASTARLSALVAFAALVATALLAALG